MRRQLLRALLIIFTVSGVLLLFGLMPISSHGAVTAQPQAQPPRPTLTPELPTPIPKDDDDNNVSPSPGRITGTVIDLTSGAPAPGRVVSVGDTTVTTDANGNYDRNNLQPGNYLVALVLTEGQGVPAQEPITVELAPGATVIQHLAFRSQPRATPTPAHAPAQAPDQPVALPRTGGLDNGLWVWVLIGITLTIGGAGVMMQCGKARRAVAVAQSTNRPGGTIAARCAGLCATETPTARSVK